MKRNKFSLSHYRLLTADMGKLVPIACFEALPGDTIQQATTALIRMQPMLAPIMHPVNVRLHHWFVPYRLIWDDFEDFITGNATPEFPTIYVTAQKGSLSDYFGLSGSQEVSALPFRAYALIYNEFYRDQDLSAELDISFDSGKDTITPKQLMSVAWEKDYFTTSRPWTQKGSDISIPISGSNAGSVNLPSIGVTPRTGTTTMQFYQSGANTTVQPGVNINATPSNTGSSARNVNMTTDAGNVNFTQFHLQGTGISVLDLRLSLALQRYEEARSKYGSRYVEYLRYLGVRSSDARLQLPEYLGGGRQIMQISEVLNNSGTGTLGDMAGHGLTAMRSNRYRRFFEEHGVVISLLSIMPKAMYVQGTNRMWLKRTKEDFFQRELQHIGMQEVYVRELKGDDTSTGSDAIFGYQDRYDEYRRIFSGVSGDFRDTLNFWHLGRDFSNKPVLNHDFITHEPTKRVFAEQTQNEFLIMANHSIQARRMMSKQAKTRTF